MKTKFANAFTVAASCNRFKTYGTLLDFNSATLNYSTVAENKTEMHVFVNATGVFPVNVDEYKRSLQAVMF